MTNFELAKLLRNKMFSDRETIDEAFEYAYSVAKGTNHAGAVMTAVMVVVNTICKEIEKNELVH